ncbi:MAG: glycerol-3-phosphate 1-O-acyltransferase PlsY [Ectothiorhodospiraceae bacterium]|nr:glycerol-3-phosphate 1-O-acyltransferase PlsY [Ectothiorhodospiraceae bacterium]MCH8504203.1 glycerol-3-phosphate 1-O-acyltransferase PlsY [Ectothiorhodospiraceae bacterium]
MIIDAILILLAYLVGSISTAVLVCRMLGLPDPRTVGSGNPGATNVLRHGGRKAAGLTLAGDFLKGTAPVLVIVLLGRDAPVVALAGVAAFLGHLYPVFFGFIGGKGVATGLGVLLAWSWPGLLATVATWLAMAALFRYSSLAALSAFLLAPLYLLLFGNPLSIVLAMVFITAVTFWRHRSNIRNLIAGKENKIGVKKPSEPE